MVVESIASVTQVENHRVGVGEDTRNGVEVGVRCSSLFFFFSPKGGEETSAVDLSHRKTGVVCSLSSDERVYCTLLFL